MDEDGYVGNHMAKFVDVIGKLADMVVLILIFSQ